MKLVSSRNTNRQVSIEEAIYQGISPDGGLYIPCDFTQILFSAKSESYMSLAQTIIGSYCFFMKGVHEAVRKVYSQPTFDTPVISPIAQTGNGNYYLELFHGPTLAFKDYALSFLPHLLSLSAKMMGKTEKQIVLTATSGDTGKAALEGFYEIAETAVFTFFPDKGVSPIQQLQMTTHAAQNAFVARVEGNFDDVQTEVKRIFGASQVTKQLAERNAVFCSANSINIGRLIPQIVYYFSAYCQMVQQGNIRSGDKINFCVPTGNFGNILAAYYAKKMGLPIQKLICASNQNNILTDFFQQKRYDRRRIFHHTSSPAMDILISSNLERLLFDLLHKDGGRVNDKMSQLKNNGYFTLNEDYDQQIMEIFHADYATETEVYTTIKKVFEEEQYLIDPHTAVAKTVYAKYIATTGDKTATVVVSTAHPYKFPDAVFEAIEGRKSTVEANETLQRLEQKTGVPIPPSIAELFTKKERFDDKITIDEMEQIILGKIETL